MSRYGRFVPHATIMRRMDAKDARFSREAKRKEILWAAAQEAASRGDVLSALAIFEATKDREEEK